MGQPLLRSKVARRLLFRFILVALLPMAGVALFTYFQVGHLLLDLSTRRLQQDSRALGMSFIDALNWRTFALKREAARLARQDGDGHAPEGYRALTVSDTAGHLDAAEARHLDAMESLLRMSDAEAPTLITRIPGSGKLLRGALDMDTLWRDEAAPEHYCVLDQHFHALYCAPGLTSPDPATLAHFLGKLHTGVFDWTAPGTDSDSTHMVAFWRANLRSSYAHPGFIVLVAESRSEVLKGLRQFHGVFPALVIAALALAVLLAINQIRRQLLPLENLASGTRRLASGDFSSRVPVQGDDEFATLATAFNHMAGSLSGKFHMLEMFAVLDRAILAGAEMEYLIQSVLARIHRVLPCDRAGLARIDPSGLADYLEASREGDESAPARLSSSGLLSCLAPAPEQPWRQVALDSPRGACLRPLFPAPLTQALVFPSNANGHIQHLLILGFQELPEDLSDLLAAGRGIADRLAVAAANLAWEEKLYHQAHYDALTDLPNRVLLRDRMDQAIARAQREHTAVAALLLDLDAFKEVNDNLGHSAGDALLVECGKRLRDQVRQGDTVARLGGDEFLVLLPDLPDSGKTRILDEIARKLGAHLAQPVLIGERLITTPASIGIAVYPDNAGNHEDLLKMADAAMYESKRQQRGSYRFYSTDMNAQAQARFELAQDLREAIGRNELCLYYQPKVNLADGRIAGAEALVRWISPLRGVVPPMQFVPLLGEMGLDDWLSEWVLETACMQMAEWDRAGLPSIPVSVNMSPGIFQREHLPRQIAEILEQHGLQPERLELEILEAVAVSDSEQVRGTLLGLREMAVGIALDDFGTGYSSLVYLTRLPANVLKLDRAFIRDLASDSRQQAIVERIIALARALDFKVVAEGVEDSAQRDLLASQGCHWIQGYLISPPLPAESFVRLWRERDHPEAG